MDKFSTIFQLKSNNGWRNVKTIISSQKSRYQAMEDLRKELCRTINEHYTTVQEIEKINKIIYIDQGATRIINFVIK